MHQRHALGWLQSLDGRTQKEMCEEHAAYPDDDGQKVQKFEQNEKHGLWGLIGETSQA